MTNPLEQWKSQTKPIRFNHLYLIAGILACLAACGVAGCNVGPKYVRPQITAPPAFKEIATQQAPDGSTWKPAQPQDAALRGKWWEVFQEPELDALEERVNISNQNIAQAYSSFMAARAQVRQARSSYFPTLSVGPSYSRNRTSQNSSSGSSGSTHGTNLNSNLFNLPFDVSWEPDLWGRIHNTVRQYANAAQVSAADLENVKLTAQANLAIYYFELRGQDALEALYQKTADVDRQSLELTQSLYKSGIDSDEAVAQAEIALKDAEAAVTNSGIARAQYEHAIALLLGAPASSFSIPTRPLTTPVPGIPVGVPSDLLERRPDIAAAERTMAEANALIGVEKAVYYPTVTISGNAGYEAMKFSKWMTSPSRYWSVGPTASETIFDGGRRKSTVAQYRALYDADVAAYKQTVLTAFQQTEDYLASLRLLSRQLAQQQDAVSSAQRYFDLASARYRTGLDPYLNVFTAQSTLLTNQQTVISLRVEQIVSSVQLIEALGGGWSAAQLPSEKEVARLP